MLFSSKWFKIRHLGYKTLKRKDNIYLYWLASSHRTEIAYFVKYLRQFWSYVKKTSNIQFRDSVSKQISNLLHPSSEALNATLDNTSILNNLFNENISIKS